MDRLRLAIVGCGTISQLNVPGYLEHEKCDVVALCDPDENRARQRAKVWGIDPNIYTSYEDLLNDSNVDAVELLTPTSMHTDQIIAGLEAGKHVSCQKPISVTLEDTERIAKAVERANTRFRITENFVYYPPLVKAKELLDSGAIGEPSMVRIRSIRGKNAEIMPSYHILPDASVWRDDKDTNPYGLMYDDGWHKYATAMWWIGDVEKVSAMVTPDPVSIYETPSIATWKYKDKDCMGVLDYASASEMPMRTRYYPIDEFFEIQGQKGSIWVTRCSGEMLDMPPVILWKGTHAENFQVPSDWIEGFKGAARHFVDSILRDEQPGLDIDFSRKVLQMALAVYESSKTERSVDPSKLY